VNTASAPPGGQFEFVVISLRSSVERREIVTNMMRELPWPWHFFDACTPEDERVLPYDPARALLRRGYRLKPGELACFESHFRCIREHALAPASAPQYRIILEDDVLLDPRYRFDCVPGLMSELGIHYLKLYSRFLTRARWLGRAGQRSLFRFVVPPYGNQAYAVSRTGAQRLVSSITRIDRPFDDEIERYWGHGLPTYALFPYPVLELSFQSTIPKGFAVNQPLSLAQKLGALGFTWAEKLPRELADRRLRKLDRALSARLARLRSENSSLLG
jgi:glycosyl transferase family 25